MTENKKRRKRKAPYDSISYTTGDIDLNINRFNQAFGTTDSSETCGSDTGALVEEAALQEAKRYVRRYYFRPMNKFVSNKAEILKTLIEIGDQNCTIYTLNNLGDDKDVSKLGSNDIIYTYDDGILKDKNGIRIMDYDLSIKKEEERKKFANVDKASDKEFKAEYEDRMTNATMLEENFDDDILATCPYDTISADYNNTGDKFIVSLNNNITDIDLVGNELAAWIEGAYGISVIDWSTNGNNVFIFELTPDNVLDLDFDDINVFGEKLTEARELYCAKCGEPIESNSHRTSFGIICNGCNSHFDAIGG